MHVMKETVERREKLQPAMHGYFHGRRRHSGSGRRLAHTQSYQLDVSNGLSDFGRDLRQYLRFFSRTSSHLELVSGFRFDHVSSNSFAPAHCATVPQLYPADP